MKDEIKIGDKVQHVFKKDEKGKPTQYKVLDKKEEPSIIDNMADLFNDTGFKNIFCLSQNGNRGWLSSQEVEKIKK